MSAENTADPKKALEGAIGKIGKAYGDLLRVAEKHGHDISKEDYEKAQFFLSETLKKIWEKIDVVRDVAKATNGGFSLDSVELPEKYRITWYSNHPEPINPHTPLNELRPDPAAKGPYEPAAIPTPVPVERMDGKSLAQAIGGRLTKSARAALAAQQSIKTDLDGDNDDAVSTDAELEQKLLDDVDFIAE